MAWGTQCESAVWQDQAIIRQDRDTVGTPGLPTIVPVSEKEEARKKRN
jgi:hypothetical protein